MLLNAYLSTVENELKVSRARSSKVEEAIKALVEDYIKEGKATTIKAISEQLGKSTQQIHQTLRKSVSIKKVKHQGRTLVVLSDMVDDFNAKVTENSK